MNVMTRPDMSLDEFLIWEARQEEKWEYDGKEPVEMTRGTLAHALFQANLIAALHRRLEGTPFQVFGSELKIQVDGRIRYPEAFIKKSRWPSEQHRCVGSHRSVRSHQPRH